MYVFPTLQPLGTVTHCSVRAGLSRHNKPLEVNGAVVGPEESIWPSAPGRAKGPKTRYS